MKHVIVALLLSTTCLAAQTKIRVEDAPGESLKDVLVIVKPLDSNSFNDIRQLTDEQGRVHPLDLKPGIYQAIATTPYGIWETSVKEFIVDNKPVDLTLSLSPQPTHGFGDIVPVRTSKTEIQVLTSAGTPASGAKVFTRDKNATLYLERWYTTDEQGKAKIEFRADPTVLVIMYDGKLCTISMARGKTHATIRLLPD